MTFFQRLLAEALQPWGDAVQFANDGLRAVEMITARNRACALTLTVPRSFRVSKGQENK